nr:hypothetical protein [Tanacetum cinerariifolium]
MTGVVIPHTKTKLRVLIVYFQKDTANLVKCRFEKITRNDNDVYLFKFVTKSRMEQVLERSSWMIHKSPIILNKWSSSVSMKKGKVNKVHIWVKLYNVPILAYSEDGLSLIATQIGKPIMLDAFTSSMCVESWGRIIFARALIEINSDSTLKKKVIIAIPKDEGDGHINKVIKIEYEWKPPYYVECKSFGHGPNLYPKRVREEAYKASSMVAKSSTIEDNEEGFVKVKSRKKKKGDDARSFGGIRLPKSNSKVHWHKKSVGSKGGFIQHLLVVLKKKWTKGMVEDVCEPCMQNPKVSDSVGTSSSNLDKKEAQEEGLWLRFKKAKDISKSKFSEEEDESDEDKVYMPHGRGFVDAIKDDFDCYDGYEARVYDLLPQEQAFCD